MRISLDKALYLQISFVPPKSWFMSDVKEKEINLYIVRYLT